MKLSRTVSYALQATLQLAQLQSESPVPCSRLAAHGNMPERFLLQILRNLVARGILRSVRGVDGGYSLERPADEVSLLELIEAIEGPLTPTLPPGDALDPQSRAKLQQTLAAITDSTRQTLAATSLSDLLPGPGDGTISVAAASSSTATGSPADRD